MIKTDGLGCSILFVNKKNKLDEPFELKYVEELTNIKKIFKDKIKITIDCGKYTLITAMCDIIKNKRNITYTYTNGQRKTNTKMYAYMNAKEKQKKETLYTYEGEKISAKKIESNLSECNFKTNDFDKLYKYLLLKCKINNVLQEEYRHNYRRYRWHAYINKQREESRMLNEFEKILGNPEDVIIVIGDWGGANLKGSMPSICKRTTKLLRKRGYEVYQIDEYNTSKLCNKCEKPMEQYKKNEGRQDEKEIWGLKCCKNKSCESNIGLKHPYRIMNRDINATLNMLNILDEIIKTGKRPKEFENTEFAKPYIKIGSN